MQNSNSKRLKLMINVFKKLLRKCPKFFLGIISLILNLVKLLRKSQELTQEVLRISPLVLSTASFLEAPTVWLKFERETFDTIFGGCGGQGQAHHVARPWVPIIDPIPIDTCDLYVTSLSYLASSFAFASTIPPTFASSCGNMLQLSDASQTPDTRFREVLYCNTNQCSLCIGICSYWNGSECEINGAMASTGSYSITDLHRSG